MFLTSIDGCDVTTSRSKSMYSAAETLVESSLTKLSSSSSSAKSVNWTSGWLFRNPHFLKQLNIVSSETSPQADFIQEIAFKTLTSWIMSVAFSLSLILEITNCKSFLRYLSLKFLMIPASNGWSLEVVFFGKNTTLMLEYRSLKLSGWHGALSIKSIIFLLATSVCRLILPRTDVIISAVIHLSDWSSNKCHGVSIKQRGFLLLHTTSGSIAFSPAAFTKNAMVSLVYDFFPHLAWLFFSARPFSGSTLKKQPVSSIFQTSASS